MHVYCAERCVYVLKCTLSDNCRKCKISEPLAKKRKPNCSSREVDRLVEQVEQCYAVIHSKCSDIVKKTRTAGRT